MNFLAIDSSTAVATVALMVGTETTTAKQDGIREHAQHLLPMVQTLMDKAGVTWTSLDGIVFGMGPGSFTGIRIACSIAKALAFTHDLPMYGVKSVDAIAYQARVRTNFETPQAILAALDARMQEVYWAYYPPETPIASSIQVTPAQAVEVPEAPVILAGWGLEHHADQWSQGLRDVIVTECVQAPEAAAMLHLVAAGHIPAMSAAEALPFYVRDQVTDK